MKKEYFKISTNLKNIIGSELITDNYVAVFELVKNAFDANAKEVKIRFEKIYSDQARIIIYDDGKGMDYNDLINKWLFVAYSAKKDGSEDFNDYRSKIQVTRYYAGAKGIGRFSCDRLGKYLNLITIKKGAGQRIENLFIDWSQFEHNPKDEFITIPVEHTIIDRIEYNIKHGTILEISGIKANEWGRENFIKLKSKLSKLIRPDLNKSLNYENFKIILEIPDELNNDLEEIKKLKDNEKDEGKIYYNTVNGEIKNFVFDELGIRTTRILAEIGSNGENITTTLIDRDLFIYEIKEKNKYKLLKNINITLYFLNTSAKAIFSRRMGIQPVEYGNVFIYKNGFRIYPYGERGDDSLGIDNRAMQGFNRFISLRNLIGQISINGTNDELVEATSRDAGLVKTKTFFELADCSPYADSLLLTTLKRLEKFVVEVTQWGINDDKYEINDSEGAKENLVKLISNIYDDALLINIKYNKELIDIIDQKEVKSAKKLLSNFKRFASETKNEQLLKDAKKLEKRINQLSTALDSANKDILDKEKFGRKLKKELDEQISETLFARAVVGVETKELLSIQHHIYRHAAQNISSFLDILSNAIINNESNDKLLSLVGKISFENKKIITLSRFVTKANFDTTTKRINADLIAFINEYVLNVYQEYKHLAVNNQKLTIKIINPENFKFDFKFKPIEIIIIIDNLLNNSFKAKSTKAILKWEKESDNEVLLRIEDDGVGITDKNLSKIFDFRFSTTSGSGLGLYHVKDVIEKMGGSISVDNKTKKGVVFLLKFKR